MWVNFPKVSIVSVNYRQAAVTCDMLQSLRKATYPNMEVILVDNGVVEDCKEQFLQKYASVKLIISEENLGFAGGTNLGIRHSTGDYILLLNNDTVVPPDFLEPMVELMQKNEKIGIISPKILYFDAPQTIQYAGIPFIRSLTGRGVVNGSGCKDEGQYDYCEETSLTNGACMMVRRGVFEQVGLLSELYFMYYEELDFCERAKDSGWLCYYCGISFIHHRQSISIGKLNPRKTYFMFRNRLLFMRRTQSGAGFWLFLSYFLLFAFPVNIARHLLKRDFDHVSSIWKGLIWHFSNLRIASDETFY